jgi:hypothetical protein
LHYYLRRGVKTWYPSQTEIDKINEPIIPKITAPKTNGSKIKCQLLARLWILALTAFAENSIPNA